jgi:hypothetical protein
MHMAVGYSFYSAALGFHVERALKALGHRVTYVGLPTEERAGFDSSVNLRDLISHMPDKPDFFLWTDPAGPYFPPGIESLPVPTACYLIDVHLGKWRTQAARFFDAVFLAQKDYVTRYRDATGHSQVEWLPLAYAPDVHSDLHLERTYDVGFVGNIAVAHGNTPRARRLKMIAERFHTNDFYRPYLPEEVGQTYSMSKIVFNASIAGDVNMRVFEGTAAGALVLTDSTANGLRDLFDADREIAVYSDDSDLLRKIEYFLYHEEERDLIACAGRERARSGHTYLHRAQVILDRLTDPSFRMCAPMRSASDDERYRARLTVYTHLHMTDSILGAAREKGKKAVGRLIDVFPALLRRLVI